MTNDRQEAIDAAERDRDRREADQERHGLVLNEPDPRGTATPMSALAQALRDLGRTPATTHEAPKETPKLLDAVAALVAAVDVRPLQPLTYFGPNTPTSDSWPVTAQMTMGQLRAIEFAVDRLRGWLEGITTT